MTPEISIHAPREGSDRQHPGMGIVEANISIHAPREGSDRVGAHCIPSGVDFYPRSPRGERPPAPTSTRVLPYFYPRSPRGERRPSSCKMELYAPISIHAPREGSDVVGEVVRKLGNDFYPRSPRGERRTPKSIWTPGSLFLSTLPARGATDEDAAVTILNGISIHAPREGSDLSLRSKSRPW